jgi:hypothetical protein
MNTKTETVKSVQQNGCGEVEIPKLRKDDDGVVQVDFSDCCNPKELYGVNTIGVIEGLIGSGINILGAQGESNMEFVPSLLAELKPRDATEAMLITQMAGTHFAVAETSRRMMDAPTFQLRESYERSTTRLSRTFLAQMDTLKKYRAKAQQVVRVERV